MLQKTSNLQSAVDPSRTLRYWHHTPYKDVIILGSDYSSKPAVSPVLHPLSRYISHCDSYDKSFTRSSCGHCGYDHLPDNHQEMYHSAEQKQWERVNSINKLYHTGGYQKICQSLMTKENTRSNDIPH